MIPTSLKLHNFTAYGSNTPELDFHPLKLVVLSGNNGAGKSSILDAITWSIWGWSRAGDNADRLVRLGETQMKVELGFELAGDQYTVTRSRKLGAVGTTTLQFFAGKNNLTEGTIKSTQEKIINTLHLTYETFINSSYLRQGHADEFTVKGPNERKKILADILGLDSYDLLEEKSKVKSKEKDDLIRVLGVQIEELEAEITSSASHQEAQSETESKLKKIQENLSSAERSLAEIASRREKHITKLEVERSKAEQLTKLRVDIAELELELANKRGELLRYRELLHDKDHIEKKYLELQKNREDLKSLEEVRSQLFKVKDGALDLRKDVNKEKLDHLSILQEVKSKAERVKEEIAKLEADLASTQSEKAVCPTCGQKLGKDEHVKVISDIQKKISEKTEEVGKFRAEYRALSTFITPSLSKLETEEKKAAELEQKSAHYPAVQKKSEELSSFETKKRDLDVAVAQEKVVREAGIRDKAQLDKLQIEIKKHAEIDLRQLEESLLELDENLRSSDLALRSLRQEESTTRERLAEAKQLVTRAAQLSEASRKKKKEMSESAEIKSNFDELAQAFGKKGIQAMLIESVIPEIEIETNKLLDKLTDGRMQVQLLTQRENKTGGIAETLDIIISDELGSRPYEMYSGGEAFRINLAIRLAISKLLTHRAGAKLQFLIIDEGFGTQDIQGKDKVVQAINLISDEFEKILVVTHDADLKEAFPQRVEVIRNASGSTFEVLS